MQEEKWFDRVRRLISNRRFPRCPSMRVAFLGLGIMGHAMATNLARAGHEVAVWNRTPGKEVEGAMAAATPADAARGREVVWMCVSDTTAVQQVLFGENGVDSVLEPGMVV